ncbi:MAG: hypothetical protein VB078_09410 [Clostridiaceae bacterium]|nr:hypothetical protein [Clostridiaceae bacterium]
MYERLKYLMPPGIDISKEIRAAAYGLSAAFIFSLGFFINLSNEYSSLFYYVDEKRVLRDGAIMRDFADFAPSSMLIFIAVAIAMIPLVAYHYIYHFQGSKSIYLMKRLPDKWELLRRCITFPVLTASAALIFAVLLILIYLAFYILVTPRSCLAPDQLSKTISVIFGGSL